MVERIFRDFDGEVFSPHFRLTTQARRRLQAPRPIKIVFFQVVSLIEAVETFTNDAVASGAGIDAATGTFDLDVVVMRDVAGTCRSQPPRPCPQGNVRRAVEK